MRHNRAQATPFTELRVSHTDGAVRAANGGGFGLGFSVVKSPVEAGLHGSAGNFAWGGAASTIFWCDPVEDISVVFFTQVMGMQPRNMLRVRANPSRPPACLSAR